MKLTMAMLLSATLLGACSGNEKKKLPREEMTRALKTEKAQTLAANMLSAIDGRDWKKFENSFASRSVTFFGEPLLLKPEEVTERMKPMIEYFDSTSHSMSDFKLDEKNERSVGLAKMNATYWKNQGFSSDVATVQGHYEFEFTQEGDSMKIMRMRFVSEKVDGEKDIVAKSMRKITTPPYSVEVVDFPGKNKRKMRGWLYLPKNKTHDVVIINGNVANIKEQGSIEYGRHLAAKGTAALVFDFMNFGESEGNVRNLEDPGQKLDDFRGAIDYIANREEFAGSRITLAGLGASAGYAAAVTVNDQRVDRVVMISPWITNLEYFQAEGFDGAAKLRAAREANRQFQQDGVLTYVPVASFSDKFAVISEKKPSAIDYYTNPDRGNIPQWQNRFASMGWSHLINFDAVSAAPRIRVPTLIVRSNSGVYEEGIQDFVSKMRVKPVEHILSVTPYEFYDREETLNQTVEIVQDFLNPASRETEVSAL